MAPNHDNRRTALSSAALVVASLTLASRILGFVREMTLAGTFGAAVATDAYLVGLTLPGALLGIAAAALAKVFIPVFAQVSETEGQGGADKLASSVINVTFLLAAAVVIAGEVFAAPLTRAIAPGFEGKALAMAVELTRYLLPMFVFQVVSGLFAGMLQTEGDFALPALTAVSYNAIIIASICLLGPTFGIRAAAWGTVAAAVGQAAFQMPGLYHKGFRWRLSIDWQDRRLRLLGSLLVPVLVGSALGQLGPVVDKILASRFLEGSISSLNYAYRLATFPHGVFGAAISVVLYPTFSRLAASGELPQLRAMLSKGIRVTAFVLVPMSLGLMVLRQPVVQLAFQRGAFDQAATQATAFAVLFYGVGIVAFGLEALLTQTFYALQDTGTPMLVIAATSGANVLLKLLLASPLKHGGLALAVSLSSACSVVVMAVLLRRRLSGLDGRAILRSVWKLALAGAGMVGAVLLAKHWMLDVWPDSGTFPLLLRLVAVTAVGAAVFVGSCLGLKVPEARSVVATGIDAARRVVRGSVAG